MQDPAVVAPEDAEVDQAVLHGAMRAPAEVTHPVVRAVCSALARDGGQGRVEQRLAGRRVLRDGHVVLDERDPPPQRQVEQQCTAQPQVEMAGIEQRPAGGGVLGQQVQVFGEGDHLDTVDRRGRRRSVSSPHDADPWAQ